MSSSFAGSFNQFGGEALPFDDGFLGSDSFSNFNSTAVESPPPIDASGGEFHSDSAFFSPEENANGPILPPPAEMGTEDGYALREWRRHNAIRLEEKEKQEKELLRQIITEAEEYKVEFHRKMQLTCSSNKATNREKEKVFVASQEKFHAEADKDYWKSISELIPKEVPAVEQRKGKKEHEKKTAVIVIQGPKPGKRTDLSRMRQILIKLKHNTPLHLKPSPAGAKLEAVSASSNRPAAMASLTEAVAVA